MANGDLPKFLEITREELQPDKPITSELMNKFRDALEFLKAWVGGPHFDNIAGAVVEHTHDGQNSALIPSRTPVVFSTPGLYTWTSPQCVPNGKSWGASGAASSGKRGVGQVHVQVHDQVRAAPTPPVQPAPGR